MKARHGIFLLIGSLLFRALGEVLGMQLSGFPLYSLSSVLWTIGMVIVLIKALSYPKLIDFWES